MDYFEIIFMTDYELSEALNFVIGMLNRAFESPEEHQDVIGYYGEVEDMLREEIVERFRKREACRYA